MEHKSRDRGRGIRFVWSARLAVLAHLYDIFSRPYSPARDLSFSAPFISPTFHRAIETFNYFEDTYEGDWEKVFLLEIESMLSEKEKNLLESFISFVGLENYFSGYEEKLKILEDRVKSLYPTFLSAFQGLVFRFPKDNLLTFFVVPFFSFSSVMASSDSIGRVLAINLQKDYLDREGYLDQKAGVVFHELVHSLFRLYPSWREKLFEILREIGISGSSDEPFVYFLAPYGILGAKIGLVPEFSIQEVLSRSPGYFRKDIQKLWEVLKDYSYDKPTQTLLEFLEEKTKRRV